MSLAAESPSLSSSSSDDFAAILDAELEFDSSETFPDDEEANSVEQADELLQEQRIKKRKFEDSESSEELQERVMVVKNLQETGTSAESEFPTNICPPHPGFFKGLCMRCGQLEEDDGSGVSFGYIHKDLKLGASEMDRLRGADLKKLLRERKLILILDLDHTLLNSTRLVDVSAEEDYLLRQANSAKDDPNRSLFRLDSIHMLTKLRPFIHNFLREASSMFEMYVYTMAERSYALEMVKLLDPRDVYFHSKVISQSDCTQRHQKGLDVVLGAESVAVILDDTEFVWQKHKENLIQMERYHFFASSCRQFGFSSKSLSESMQDESEPDGALATIINVLKNTHQRFFDPELGTDLSARDVRQVMKRIRQEILQGCKIVFSRVFPFKSRAEDQTIWKVAEQLGATCSADVDSSVTHVIAMDPGTEKARWAVQNKKFLVSPRWIEAANYRWNRPKEEDFTIGAPRNN